MKQENIRFHAIPTTEEVKAERERLEYRSRYGRVLRSTIYALLVVAAAAVLLPVLQVSGDSMNPTLEDKDFWCWSRGKTWRPATCAPSIGRTSC